MDVRFSTAAQAYGQAAKRVAEAAPPKPAEPAEEFSGLVKNAIAASIDQAREGEVVSMGAVANKAELNEIVTSVTNAEVTLQAVVAIRDRVIQAYQEIIKMPL